jgi:cell division protein FtsL
VKGFRVSDGLNDIPGVRQAAAALNEGLFLRGNIADAVKKRDFRRTAWSLGLLCLVVLLFVWAHMMTVRLGYDVQDLRSQTRRLTNQYYYMKYRLSDVRSLTRVEMEARGRLGMVTPRTDQVVIVPDGGLRLPLWMLSWGGDR